MCLCKRLKPIVGRFGEVKAFTLIEILLVIGIIAILALALVIAINPGEKLAQARDVTRERHIYAIEQAILAYRISKGHFPNNINNIGSEICNTNITLSNECGDLIDLSLLVEEGYLPQIPINPTTEKNTSSTGYNIAIVEDKVAVWPTESETRQMGTRPVLEFDGADDYVEVGKLDPDTSKLTVAGWMYHTTSAIENDHSGIVLWGDWNEQFSYYTRDVLNPFHSITINGDNRRFATVKGMDYFKEKWVHFALTIDDGNAKLYIDSEKVLEDDWGVASLDLTNDLFFGGDNYQLDNLEGKLDDVRIYNRALLESEIEYLYKGKNITDGLVGHWPLSEGKGCTAYDYSGNNNHGTLEPDCINENAPEWVIGR